MSRDTIKRRRIAGAFPNAYQGERGAWLIPITDLLAAGFQPTMSKPDEPQQLDVEPERAAVNPGRDDRVTELEHQNELLRVQLESQTQLRAMADQVADDLRRSLRMLEAAPTPQPAPVEPDPRQSVGGGTSSLWITPVDNPFYVSLNRSRDLNVSGPG